jgi:hypothetical protein
MMRGVDRRLTQIEGRAFKHDAMALRHAADEALRRHAAIPGYADVMDDFTALVEACEAVPPPGWSDTPLTRAVVATLTDMCRDEGLDAGTPEQVDQWTQFLYRWQVVTETPAGQEYLNRCADLREMERRTNDTGIQDTPATRNHDD